MNVICIKTFTAYKLPSDLIDVSKGIISYNIDNRKVLCGIGERYVIYISDSFIQLLGDNGVIFALKSDIDKFITLGELREDNIKKILDV